MNLCFISGKVANKIDLKFIYNPVTKSLNKRHTSIVLVNLELEDSQIIKLCGYDEMADYIYKNIKQNDIIWIRGSISMDIVEIYEILR